MSSARPTRLTKEIFINIVMKFMDASIFAKASLISKEWKEWMDDPKFWIKGMKFFGFSEKLLQLPVYQDITIQRKICFRLAKLEQNASKYLKWLQANIIENSLNFRLYGFLVHWPMLIGIIT